MQFPHQIEEKIKHIVSNPVVMFNVTQLIAEKIDNADARHKAEFQKNAHKIMEFMKSIVLEAEPPADIELPNSVQKNIISH